MAGQKTLDIEGEVRTLKKIVELSNDEIASLMAKNADLEARNQSAEKAISDLQDLIAKSGIGKGDDDTVSMIHNTYTFLYTTPIRSGPFAAGLTPCLMQYAVFSLFLLDLLNTEQIPPDVATIVRACQIMAIIIAFLVETDMLRALRAVIYREGFEEMKNNFDGFVPWKFYVSNVLMGLQGLLSKFVAFFLIIFADNVFDLLLNFTAVMFVSELDEIFFLLSMAGYIGNKSEQLSKNIFKAKLPQKPPNGILRYLHVVFYGVFLVAAVVDFSFIASQQNSQESLAQYVKVQFGDEVDPTLGLFSGCYEKKMNDGWDARVRYVQTKADRGQGDFEYCLDDGIQTWVFANEKLETACDGKFLLRSAEERSTSFDLLDAKGDQWLLGTGNPISEFQLGKINADRFDVECGNIEISGSERNSSEELCPVLFVDADDDGFSASDDWSRTFVFLKNSNGQAVQFYQHPVFVAEYLSDPGPEGYEVLFFTGRRWVLARTAKLLPEEKRSWVDVVSLFESSGFWLLELGDEAALAFISEGVSQGNDRGTPLGLQWYNARYAEDVAFPFADITRPVDATFRCGKCNSRSNPCLYEGTCEGDGTCSCHHGASGKLCEVKPLEDGECNVYFNKASDGYDGGDCCVGTCSKSNCGVNSTNFAFGQNLKRTGIGFPNCIDPLMVPLTIHLQTELEEAETKFFESYEVQVMCEQGEQVPLRVSLEPTIVGSLNETLRLKEELDSCLLKFSGIRSTSGLNISYQIFDGVDSSPPGSMLLMSEEGSITGDSEFIIPALYSRCLKDALAGVIDENLLYTGSYQDRAFAWLSEDMSKNAKCSPDQQYLTERYALLALSNAEQAPKNWIFSGTHCLWERVNCDGSRVVELKYDGAINGPLNGTLASEFTLLRNLERFDVLLNNFTQGPIPTEISQLTALTALVMPGNQRSGTIPSELFELTALRDLTMAGNVLSGSVPSEVGRLSSLEVLTLFSNAVSGTIPTEVWKLRMLTTLGLSDNTFSGSIPSEVGNLASLINLNCHENMLSGSIPSEIGNLSALEQLVLSTNALSGNIPSEVGNLASLTVLGAHENMLSGSIPSEVGNLSALTDLRLKKNSISGTLPSEIGNMGSLRYLSLDNNSISGTIPSEFGNLSSLISLRLRENSVSGTVPSEVGNLGALAELGLSKNALNGTLPVEIGDLSALNELVLHTNALSGTLPSEVGKLGALRGLFLYRNALSGRIPSEIGNMGALTALDLSTNALSGAIPSEVGNLSALNMLNSIKNSLSGTLPTEIGKLGSLTKLSLYSNPLSGTIPSEIGRLGALQEFFMYDTTLSGSIPSEIGNMSALVILDLPSNFLTGMIPSEVGNLSALTYLAFFSNALSGSIPSEIGNLSAVKVLSLFENPLSGTIPSEIGNLSAVEFLALSDDGLSGNVPSEIGKLSALTQLSLQRNALSGPLPKEFVNLSVLENAYMHNNTFTGSIPSDFGKMSSLKVLYLSTNSLTGTLPSEVGKLSNLTKLTLETNLLSGMIPTEIGYLSALESLHFSENSLSGNIPSEIGALSTLTDLRLHSNTLNGRLPSEIGLMTNLQTLQLGGNQLSGPLPTEIIQLTNLKVLDLSGNLFNEEEVKNVMDTLFPPFSCNETTVEVALTTDAYPAETSWGITTDDEIVASVRGYSLPNFAYNEMMCVPSDACTFILLDQYSDGGPSVEITRLGKVYQIDGAFADQVVINICA